MQETQNIDYSKLCKWCGEELKQPEGICPKCDVEDNGNKPVKRTAESKEYNEVFDNIINKKTMGKKGDGYDWLTTLLLCFFVGFLGVHRFYTKNTLIGVAQLLTFGGCGIWTTIDFVLIVAGTYKDGNGKNLSK